MESSALETLLSSLDEDRDRAGERYEVLRVKLVRYFDARGAADPEGLSDEALDRLARRIESGERIERDVSAYALGIARNVLRESWAKRRREEALEDGGAGLAEPEGGEDEKDILAERLERCLERLPAERRALVLRYYEGSGQIKIHGRQGIADAMGLSMNSLRIRVYRIRQELEDCMKRSETK